LLTEYRNKEAALRFLTKAIRQNGLPETITIDGSDANAAAIKSYNQEHGTAIAIRQVTYLNPSCHLLKSMGFCLTLKVKSPISPQEEQAHGRQNYRDVLPV
jgi:hypothetical protein